MATINLKGGPTLEMYCEQIETTSIDPHEKDPDWFERDDHAHEHTWESGTFEWVIDFEGVDADGDEYSEGHYACKVCRDTVTPRMRPLLGGFRTFMAGPRHYLIDGREVTKSEFDAAVAAATADITTK